jgi:glyoxylase-like metal-dependent hydrolase (beta-lactamase superfamily II)
VPGFHTLVGGSTPVDRLLEDNQTIAVGDTTLQVIHTLGHAAGSISLFCKEDGVLLAGDAIPQVNDLPIYDDVAVSVESIHRLQSIPGIRYLLASWTDPKERDEAFAMMDEGLNISRGSMIRFAKLWQKSRLKSRWRFVKRWFWSWVYQKSPSTPLLPGHLCRISEFLTGRI